MASRSAGMLLFRRDVTGVAVLLVHPGGPFWQRKDAGAWQIPKGLIEPGEQPVDTARRELAEEIGVIATQDVIPLAVIRQAGGKIVEAFALEQQFDPATLRSNLFEIEWPPRSGKRAQFPEVDAARWFSLEEARAMMLPSQLPLLDALAALAP